MERLAFGAFVGGTGDGCGRDHGCFVLVVADCDSRGWLGNVVVVSTAFRCRKHVVLWRSSARLCMGTGRIECSTIPAYELAAFGGCNGAWSSVSLGDVRSLGRLANGALARWLDWDCGSFACDIWRQDLIHPEIMKVLAEMVVCFVDDWWK